MLLACRHSDSIRPGAQRLPSVVKDFEERKQRLFEVIDRAQSGNQDAKDTLSKILVNELEPWIERRLKVRWQDRQDAHQEVILRVRQRIEQLRDTGKFFSWLLRIVSDVSRKYWIPCVRLSEPDQESRPKQIRNKTLLIDGEQHLVRVFEPYIRRGQAARQPRLEPLSDSITTNWSKDNRPNYPRSVDFRRALTKLPNRWALAISLVFQEGYSRTEAAEIMGISRSRIYKLHQKARKRLRLLLPGYSLRKAKSKTQSCNAKLAQEGLAAEIVLQENDKTVGNASADGIDGESCFGMHTLCSSHFSRSG